VCLSAQCDQCRLSKLLKDEATVCNALTYTWSNGPVDVPFNWLKLLRRRMYGRVKLDLLRAHLLYAHEVVVRVSESAGADHQDCTRTDEPKSVLTLPRNTHPQQSGEAIVAQIAKTFG
jgi:hypothetical protein